MKKLEISPDFTIEDIHKIREDNYERRKNMTSDEYIADIQKGANKMLAILAKRKEEKLCV